MRELLRKPRLLSTETGRRNGSSAEEKKNIKVSCQGNGVIFKNGKLVHPRLLVLHTYPCRQSSKKSRNTWSCGDIRCSSTQREQEKKNRKLVGHQRIVDLKNAKIEYFRKYFENVLTFTKFTVVRHPLY